MGNANFIGKRFIYCDQLIFQKDNVYLSLSLKEMENVYYCTNSYTRVVVVVIDIVSSIHSLTVLFNISDGEARKNMT